MARTPRRGEPVDAPCTRCDRQPRPGERHGVGPDDWDFTGLCPQCWDTVTIDPEDAEAEAQALEQDAVRESFGDDGLLYEELTGKTLGDK